MNGACLLVEAHFVILSYYFTAAQLKVCSEFVRAFLYDTTAYRAPIWFLYFKKIGKQLTQTVF
jgi:hypothetical protein